MSRFLRVGLISDRIEDIIEAANLLLKEDGPTERRKELAFDILDIAENIKEFLKRWDSEPIIYTGRGSTDEVIDMLDYLLNNADRVG